MFFFGVRKLHILIYLYVTNHNSKKNKNKKIKQPIITTNHIKQYAMLALNVPMTLLCYSFDV